MNTLFIVLIREYVEKGGGIYIKIFHRQGILWTGHFKDRTSIHRTFHRLSTLKIGHSIDRTSMDRIFRSLDISKTGHFKDRTF